MRRRMLTVYYEDFNNKVIVKYDQNTLLLNKKLELRFVKRLLKEVKDYKKIIEEKHQCNTFSNSKLK